MDRPSVLREVFSYLYGTPAEIFDPSVPVDGLLENWTQEKLQLLRLLLSRPQTDPEIADVYACVLGRIEPMLEHPPADLSDRELQAARLRFWRIDVE